MENWEINRGPHSKGLIRSMADLISEEYMEYKRVWPLNRPSYSGDSRLYQFYALAGPVNTAATQILKTELHNYGHNIPIRFTQADKSNKKTHALMVYLPRFLFFPRPLWFEWLRFPLQIYTCDPTGTRPLVCDGTLAVMNQSQTNTWKQKRWPLPPGHSFFNISLKNIPI